MTVGGGDVQGCKHLLQRKGAGTTPSIRRRPQRQRMRHVDKGRTGTIPQPRTYFVHRGIHTCACVKEGLNTVHVAQATPLQHQPLRAGTGTGIGVVCRERGLRVLRRIPLRADTWTKAVTTINAATTAPTKIGGERHHCEGSRGLNHGWFVRVVCPRRTKEGLRGGAGTRGT